MRAATPLEFCFLVSVGLLVGAGHAASAANLAAARRGLAMSEDAAQQSSRARLAALAASFRGAWNAAGLSPETSEMPPSIISVKVLTPVVNVAKPPAVPAVQVQYRTKNGFGAVQLDFYSPSTGQAFSVLFRAPAGTSLPPNGSLVIEDPGQSLSLYAAAGTWSVTANMVDRAGYGGYGPATPETFQVVNDVAQDVTPPVIVSGQILTPTVSLSSPYPAFQTMLQVSDDRSGAVSVVLYLLPYGVPQGPTLFTSMAPRPVTRTQPFRASGLFGNVPIGQWTINEVDVVDAAGNRNGYVGDAITAIFGTNSFTVTP